LRPGRRAGVARGRVGGAGQRRLRRRRRADRQRREGDSTGGGREPGEPTYASLGSPSGASVWWRWSSSRTRNVVLDTCGSAVDARVTVFSGASVDALTEREWSFGRCPGGTAWTISFVAMAGVTYHIAVVGQTGAGAIVLNLHAPPANDDFAAATELTGATATVVGTNAGAGSEPSEPLHPESGRASVWYRWVAPASGPVALSTCGSTSVKRVGVYTGSVLGALVAVPSRITTCMLQSVTTFMATAGVTYDLAVDAPLHAPGDILLKLAPPPANDEFADAIALTGTTATATGTNVGADTEDGEPSAAGGGSTIWWRWTAPDRRMVTVDTCASALSASPEVFTGSAVDALQRVSHYAEGPCGGQSSLTFAAEPGVTYSIAVDGTYGTTGDVVLHLDAPQPPPNDSFADAATLGGSPAAAAGSNENATREPGEPDIGFFGTTTVWWRWTAPANRRVVLDTCASAFDTRLDVYTGATLDTLTQAAGNDDACGTRSRVTFVAAAGTTYSIRVVGRLDASGAIALNLVPASNDAFADAVELAGFTATATASNAAATAEAGEPNHAGLPGGKSVWWRWTAPASGRLTIDTCASSFDTLLAVYTGSGLGFLRSAASSEDACGDGRSRLTLAVGAGETYFIAVDGFAGATGQVVLALSAPPPPANDDVAHAAVLSGIQARAAGSNVGAGAEAGEPLHAGIFGGVSVWWRWTAPITAIATVATCGSEPETLTGIYTGTGPGDLVEVEVGEAFCGAQSVVAFAAVAGTSYLIAVDGFTGETGTIELEVEVDAQPAAVAPVPVPPPVAHQAAPVRQPALPQPGCARTGTVLVGKAGRDVLRGTAATDILFGRGGRDELLGRGGADCLYGEGGNDSLAGGSGSDALFGGDGADRLTDVDGRDRFSGGRGNDRIDARDRLPGGRRAADTVSCGAGRDRALVDRRDRVASDCEVVRRR
jgi:Ca2+-binding RTX toxin-like protein